MTKNEFEKRIDNLISEPSSNELLVESIKWITIDKENRCSLLISMSFSVILGIIVSFSQDTIILFESVISIFLDVLLVMFGVIFTAFALLQAYINISILKSMIPKSFEEKNDLEVNYDKSKFPIHKANENFTNLLMLTLIDVFILMALKIILKFISPDFMLFSCMLFSNICCTLLSSVLFTFVIDNVILVKSIIRDLYILFNLGTCIAILQIIQENDKNE